MIKQLRSFTIPQILLGACLVICALATVLILREKSELKRAAKKPAYLAAAESARHQELEKFNLTGFDEQGRRFWNLEGESAKIDPTQNVSLDQNVTLKLQDGTVIRTDNVQWQPKEGQLQTDAKVVVDHKTVRIEGMGAIGKPNDGFVQLNRTIFMKINAVSTLTCKGPMKIFYKENKMIFYRDVLVVDDKGKLRANRMDVYFDPSDKKINRIIAMGRVMIERAGDTTRSQRAIYDIKTGSVRLEGNPEITLHQDSSKVLDVPFRS